MKRDEDGDEDGAGDGGNEWCLKVVEIVRRYTDGCGNQGEAKIKISLELGFVLAPCCAFHGKNKGQSASVATILGFEGNWSSVKPLHI